MKAVGSKIIVKFETTPEKTSAGGIIIAVNDKTEKFQNQEGTILSIGPDAKELLEEVVEGDLIGKKVIFNRHTGGHLPNASFGCTDDYMVYKWVEFQDIVAIS